jgi:hypothetical protein
MVGFMSGLQTLHLEHGIDGHEDVVVLRGNGAGGRLCQPRVGF